MRQKFVMTDDVMVAIDECPWASWIVPVTDGFQCFESNSDVIPFMNASEDPVIPLYCEHLVTLVLKKSDCADCAACVSEPICYKSKL